MGGSSRSNQTTKNDQTTNNYVNDGEFAGAGNVSIDESNNSVNDSNNTDNSQEWDIDNSQEWDIETDIDNSVGIEDSYNTDNSIENDGYLAGGDVNVLDGGAIDAAKDIAITALEESTKQNEAATNLSSLAIESNERSTRNALDANERTVGRAFNSMEFAIDEISDVASSSVEQVGETSSHIISEISNASTEFAENLNQAAQVNFATNEKALASVAQASTNDKEIIAELARNTALAGQDIVAQSSEKMTMYMAIAVGVGFVALLFIGARK